MADSNGIRAALSFAFDPATSRVISPNRGPAIPTQLAHINLADDMYAVLSTQFGAVRQVQGLHQGPGILEEARANMEVQLVKEGRGWVAGLVAGPRCLGFSAMHPAGPLLLGARAVVRDRHANVRLQSLELGLRYTPVERPDLLFTFHTTLQHLFNPTPAAAVFLSVTHRLDPELRVYSNVAVAATVEKSVEGTELGTVTAHASVLCPAPASLGPATIKASVGHDGEPFMSAVVERLFLTRGLLVLGIRCRPTGILLQAEVGFNPI